MRVRSLHGHEAELLPISSCPQCGLVPHVEGEHGSLTCAVCGSVPQGGPGRRVTP
jgi:uncharacterized Zn finger protein (UPF0148 family)